MGLLRPHKMSLKLEEIDYRPSDVIQRSDGVEA